MTQLWWVVAAAIWTSTWLFAIWGIGAIFGLAGAFLVLFLFGVAVAVIHAGYCDYKASVQAA